LTIEQYPITYYVAVAALLWKYSVDKQTKMFDGEFNSGRIFFKINLS